MDLQQEKQRLRAALKERLSHVSDDERKTESRSLCKQLLHHLPVEKPGILCAYYPLRDEVDIRPALLTLLDEGWKIFLPCYEDKKLIFRRITTIKELPVGPLGTTEAPRDAEPLNLQEFSYVILPGRGFNERGDRIGRGNGGYDTWLHVLHAVQKENSAKSIVWGVALQAQMTQDIPMEKHDVQMDGIVTARGFIDCKQQKKV